MECSLGKQEPEEFSETLSITSLVWAILFVGFTAVMRNELQGEVALVCGVNN